MYSALILLVTEMVQWLNEEMKLVSDGAVLMQH
jgi:hypothetical protein